MHLERQTAIFLGSRFFYIHFTFFSYLCRMVYFISKRLTIFLLLTMFNYVAVSQNTVPRPVVQIAGVVVDDENLRPIPHVNVSVRGTHRGTSADMNGFFTLVTLAGDYLVFSAIGFRTTTIKIPDTLPADRYTLYQSLSRDTLELPVTVIFPWPSRERFREAFLNLDIPDDDYDIARRNVLLSELRDRARHSPMDAQMNFRHLTQQRADRMYWAGQHQPNNLLNPMAWAQFLRIWNAQRDERRREQRVRQWDFYEP